MMAQNGGKGTKAGATKNPWINHVKNFKLKHPTMSYKDCMKNAKHTYNKKGSIPKKEEGEVRHATQKEIPIDINKQIDNVFEDARRKKLTPVLKNTEDEMNDYINRYNLYIRTNAPKIKIIQKKKRWELTTEEQEIVQEIEHLQIRMKSLKQYISQEVRKIQKRK